MARVSSKNLFSHVKLVIAVGCVHLLFTPANAGSVGLGKDDKSISDRTSKNLFPFLWVTFQNSPCGGGTGTPNNGVCMQRGKCRRRGGTTGGSCQDGFGECCTFTERCNSTNTQIDVNNMVTTLLSPQSINTQCSFRFRKEPNICQIRLDFLSMSKLTKANADGMCDMDRLKITNTITVEDFTTCGDLTGQHMYLTFGNQDRIEVTPFLKTAGSQYNIVATRIPCNSPYRAPDYCLQYFNDTTAQVKSFDFGPQGQQQDKQRYTVCVNPLPGSTSIQWQPCAGTGNQFDIVSPDAMGAPRTTCTTDWVQVRGKPMVCENFGSIPSMWKPYELLVNFDDEELQPPPPQFENTEVDPENCATGCINVGDFDCECMGPMGNQTCLCILQTVVDPAAPPAGISILPSDIGNTGFCLEYMQL